MTGDGAGRQTYEEQYAAANGGSSPQPKPQPKPKRRRKRLPRWADRLITIVIILIGVGLMTWPWILDRLEASGVFNQISTVSSTVDALSAEERERILLQARSFNEQLAGEATELPADQIEPYAQQLIFDRDPMMSWVEIPSIDVSMPIYHGTSEEVLMAGVGHLEGTSLPVGGTSTHCVLTAHSGMRNLSMFDDIHSLEPGDLVLLHTMNKTLAYKMVDSEVVLPEEMESLTIEPGADKVTLVTCTPYGVNDHRLLVHCVRTKYNKKDVDKQKSLAGRHWGKREFAVLIVAVAIVLLLLDIVIHAVRKRRKAKARHKTFSRTTTMGAGTFVVVGGFQTITTFDENRDFDEKCRML